VLIFIFLIAVVGFFFSTPSSSVKQASGTNNIERLVAVSDDSLYYLAAGNLIQQSLSNTKNITLVANEVAAVSKSPDGNKIYYSKGFGDKSEKYILNLQTGETKKYLGATFFIWNQNSGLFLYPAGRTNQLKNEAGGMAFADVPFQNLLTINNLILGYIQDTATFSPEVSGFRYKIINPQPGGAKEISILNTESNQHPNGSFLLYPTAGGEKLAILGENGKERIVNSAIPLNSLSYSDSNTPITITFDTTKSSYKLGRLNLESGALEQLSTFSSDSFLGKDVEAIENFEVKDVVVNNNTAYFLVNGYIWEYQL
jgi:hypothetical protein